MSRIHKPHSGSLAFYPRKRAKKETPSFRTIGAAGESRALNFLGYKAGMVHAIAKNEHQKSVTFGQDIVVPCTVIECPPLKVFGVRAYVRTPYGARVLGESTIGKPDRFLRKKIKGFKQKHGKQKGEKKEAGQMEGKKTEVQETSVAGLEREKEKVNALRLLVATQPNLADFGKKKPEISEVFLAGSVDEQFEFAKEKLGKELRASEVFQEKQFVDVKAVDAGKGFSGVIKRFGVKVQRPKAKKRRIVGSISPWSPSTVMWTVPRPGQMGYQSRTELNKRIVKVSSKPAEVNVPAGFKGYGKVKGEFLLLAGSVPAPVKRAVALRHAVRKATHDRFNVSGMRVIGTKTGGKEIDEEESVKPQKVAEEKKEKKEHKSVEDEIQAALKGDKEKKPKGK